MGMKITTSMYTTTSGYQHANYNVSLATSQLYTISPAGYGNALFKYNNAVGVDITL